MSQPPSRLPFFKTRRVEWQCIKDFLQTANTRLDRPQFKLDIHHDWMG